MSDELPVEQLADGLGTVLMGKPDSRLNIKNALGCPMTTAELARVLMVEFNKEQRAAYINEQSIRNIILLGIALAYITVTNTAYFEILSVSFEQVNELLGELYDRCMCDGVTSENAADFL